MQLPKHLFFAVDGKEDFIVYNSTENLERIEILNEDIFKVQLTGKKIQKLRSEAWSSGCRFFFIIQPHGIFLCSVYENESLFCRKKSIHFIKRYLDYQGTNKWKKKKA